MSEHLVTTGFWSASICGRAGRPSPPWGAAGPCRPALAQVEGRGRRGPRRARKSCSPWPAAPRPAGRESCQPTCCAGGENRASRLAVHRARIVPADLLCTGRESCQPTCCAGGMEQGLTAPARATGGGGPSTECCADGHRAPPCPAHSSACCHHPVDRSVGDFDCSYIAQ